MDLGCAATASVTKAGFRWKEFGGPSLASGVQFRPAGRVAAEQLLTELRTSGHQVPGLDFSLELDIPHGLDSRSAVQAAVLACIADLLDVPDLTGPNHDVTPSLMNVDWPGADVELLVLAGLPVEQPADDHRLDTELGAAAVELIQHGRLAEIGPLLLQAHRPDPVCAPAAELAVQVLLTFDAYGARRTPNGAVVGLLTPRQARAARVGIDGAFGGRGYAQPVITTGTDRRPRPLD